MTTEKRRNFAERIGQRFGRLVVVSESRKTYYADGSRNDIYFFCACNCGNVKEVSWRQMLKGHATSCGCYQQECRRTNNLRHGNHTGYKKTKELSTWHSMTSRCRLTSREDSALYSARGISVCERWQTFENFLADMGPAPTKKHSLDRIDVNKGYSPDNCRWATPKEQARNKRDTIRCTVRGKLAPLKEHCEVYRKTYQTMYYWIVKKGYDPDDVFFDRVPRK